MGFLIGIAALAVSLAGSTAASAAGPSYVAMGDSYTSGPGLVPYEPTEQAEKCGRSTINYPHLAAAALGLSLTDVSCGGADTSDETQSQFAGQPPQDEALNSSTEVVTLGMGGNDHELFGTILFGCTELDGVEGSSVNAACAKKYESFVKAAYKEDKPEQEAALKHIKELAPHAKVFVVGYPEIAPNHGWCFFSWPWHEADLKWFRNKVEKVGNKLIEQAAKKAGATFVETFKPSEGHNACEPVGTRWIEPIVEPLTGVPAHPNAMGQEATAADVEQAMRAKGI